MREMGHVMYTFSIPQPSFHLTVVNKNMNGMK